MPNVLATQIIRTVLRLIINTNTDSLDAGDSSKIEMTELRPRSGKFSRVGLSCSMAPNDPADPNAWHDEEITSPGREYNAYSHNQFIEMGLGQYWNLRFSIDYTFFFMKLKIEREEALDIAEEIFARTHLDLIKAGEVRGGAFSNLHRKDDFGNGLIRSNNCVKKKVLRPGGSDKKTLYKGKMWLQFESYIEA